MVPAKNTDDCREMCPMCCRKSRESFDPARTSRSGPTLGIFGATEEFGINSINLERQLATQKSRKVARAACSGQWTGAMYFLPEAQPLAIAAGLGYRQSVRQNPILGQFQTARIAGHSQYKNHAARRIRTQECPDGYSQRPLRIARSGRSVSCARALQTELPRSPEFERFWT